MSPLTYLDKVQAKSPSVSKSADPKYGSPELLVRESASSLALVREGNPFQILEKTAFFLALTLSRQCRDGSWFPVCGKETCATELTFVKDFEGAGRRVECVTPEYGGGWLSAGVGCGPQVVGEHELQKA